MPRITDVTIRSAKLPERGQYVIYDTLVKGFGLRLSQGGSRSFILVLLRNGSKRKVTIGQFPDISLAQARDAAKTLLAKHTLTPFTPTRESLSLGDAVQLYLATYSRHHHRPSWTKQTEGLLQRNFSHLASRPLLHIEPREITAIIDHLLPTPSAANHAFAAARRFFNWAVERDYIDCSPLSKLKPPAKEQSRDRVLTDDELTCIFSTALRHPSTFTRILMLLIATGSRRNEIASLRWSFIDDSQQLISLPPALTKNNSSHTFPYGSVAAQTISDTPRFTHDLLFPARGHHDRPYNGWSKAKAAFDAMCPLPHYTLHDLRRTYASSLAALGCPVHVLSKLLNHASGPISGVHAIYNRYSYRDEMRHAVQLWDAKLQSLLSQITS